MDEFLFVRKDYVNMKYDVFLSHANADKINFVEKLKQSFDKLGISVFYDKDSIEWGNNWSQKIAEGLDKCDFGVVIVSKDFYDREWTEKELKSLLIRQNKNGDNIILPILYNTNLDELKKHCKKSCYKDLVKIQFIRFPEDYDIKDITILLAKKLLANTAVNSKRSSVLSNNDIFDKFFEGHSYEFDLWLKSLIESNNDWADDYNEDFINWHHLTIDGNSIPLIQQRYREYDNPIIFGNDVGSEYQYRINPIYFDDFCTYFDKNIRPQLL